MRLIAGETVAVLSRTMTVERMRAYCEGLDTAAANDGRTHEAGSNIHTDLAVAIRLGLPHRVADGMIVTSWVSELLVATFGADYLTGGRLRTRFARPVFEAETIEVRLDVAAVETQMSGRRLVILIVTGRTGSATSACVTGEATVTVGPATWT